MIGTLIREDKKSLLLAFLLKIVREDLWNKKEIEVSGKKIVKKETN